MKLGVLTPDTELYQLPTEGKEQERVPEMTTTGKGGKGGKPKARSQRRVQEFDEAHERYEEE